MTMNKFNFFKRKYIHDVTELEFFNKIVPYIQKSRLISLYRTPTEQLLNAVRDNDKLIVHSTPVTYSDGITHWSDFTIYDKGKGFFVRFEIKKLTPKSSGLDASPFKALKYSKHMVENLFVFLLIGEGYNEITPMLRETIADERLRVTIIRTMEDAVEFIRRNLE